MRVIMTARVIVTMRKKSGNESDSDSESKSNGGRDRKLIVC